MVSNGSKCLQNGSKWIQMAQTGSQQVQLGPSLIKPNQDQNQDHLAKVWTYGLVKLNDSINATIRIGQQIQCLLYVVFLYHPSLLLLIQILGPPPLPVSTNSWSQDLLSPVCGIFKYLLSHPLLIQFLKTPSLFFSHQDRGR